MSAKVLSIKRELPPTSVEATLVSAANQKYVKVLVVGQLGDGTWCFQFGNVTSKVEVIGMLEFMKLEIHESMAEVSEEC